MLTRRGLLTGLTAALAAPAIVRIDNIMPVRNRLIVPKSYLYNGPDPVYTFSCYLKAENAGPLFLLRTPNEERVQGLSPVGKGWYRYTTQFTSPEATITLPSPKMYGAQVEWNGGGEPEFKLNLRNPEGDGVLAMPSTNNGLAG